MSNFKANNDRPHSPSSTKAASELLQFVSKSSSGQKNRMMPPPHLIALTPGFTSNLMTHAHVGDSPRFAVAASSVMSPVMTNAGYPNAEMNALSAPFMHHLMMGISSATAQRQAPHGDFFASDNNEDQNQGVNADSEAVTRSCINRPIDHTYTDYAPVSEQELRELDQNHALAKDPKYSPEKRRLMQKLKVMPSKPEDGQQSFPAKLYVVLSDPALSEIISWMSHGRAFVIKNQNALVSEVLPKFFHQTKYLSFVRQLNLWGFKRVSRVVEGKVYYHELFLRGRPYMALRVKRFKLKGHGCKPVPNPAGEPNFFCFTQVDELCSAEASKFKEAKEACSQRHPVSTSQKTTSATRPSQLFGLKNDCPKVSDKKLAADTNESDSKHVTSAFVGVRHIIPPNAAATTTLGVKPAVVEPSARPEEPSDNERLHAMSQPCKHPAALSGATAPAMLVNLAGNRADYAVPSAAAPNKMDDILAQNTRLAALSGLRTVYPNSHHAAHYPALMRLDAGVDYRNGGEYAVGLSSYISSSNTDDILTQRLAQLQKEQKDIETLRKIRMLEDLKASQLTSQAMTVADAIKEAKHLEELAAASRNRVRMLALISAMESRPDYGSILRNPQNQEKNEI